VLDTSAGPNLSATASDSDSNSDSRSLKPRSPRERKAVLARGAAVARTVRRHRAVALRAGAGAAVLLGVTAAVDGLTTLGTGPARAAALSDGSVGAAPAGSSADALRPALLEDHEAKASSNLIADQAEATRREAALAHARHEVAQANARARQAAAQQAARQAAQQAAARKAAAARARQQTASRSSIRDPRSAARALLAARGWSGQFGCLDALWERESQWNPHAYNASSGAFGIPQALPGGKMASAGSDWRTNPVTQIRWGLDYIASTYGTPCGAWAHSQAYNWY
jgi:hypothetical protein